MTINFAATAVRETHDVRYVGVAEYAELMGLSTRTIYAYLAKGLSPGAMQAGKGASYRIPVVDPQ